MAAPAPVVAPPAHDPVGLARHYSRFGVADRLGLTGHSHQAWPDVAFEAQQQAWLDAAELWDAKWERAFARADRVRRGWATWLGDDGSGEVTLADSTHTLLVRLLSGLDLAARPRVVTTDAEFHSARRQLARLAETGLEVVRVPAEPVDDLAARLAAAVDDRTAAVLVSKVLFATARVVPDLAVLAQACRRRGAALVVDTYHALGALDWTIAEDDLADAFVLGGGYKYLQHGEGSCFLRWPRDCALRPVVTGWYAEFGTLQQPAGAEVGYGEGPERFAGATYDPTSHYRAARVLDFFDSEGLDRTRLRATSRYQVGRLAAAVDDLDLPPDQLHRALADVPGEQVGGFLALRTPHAAALQRALAGRGVLTDSRGDVLRLGPAPYLRDDQLDAAVGLLGECVRALG